MLMINTHKWKRIGVVMVLAVVGIVAKADNLSDIQALKTASYQAAATEIALLKTFGQKAPMVMKKVDSPLVFVSLGMPDALLKQILQEAYTLHMSVVIRGLFHDSFDATLKRLFSLMPPDKKAQQQQSGVLINPLWFRKYHIQTVPAVVVPQGSTYDVIFGNITLHEALKRLAEHHHKGQ